MEDSNEEYHILSSICTSVLWNSSRQKVNKGTYYVIPISNCIYNILVGNEEIIINEWTKINFDEQTQNDDVLQERKIILINDKKEYYYSSKKHAKTGSTFYTKSYSNKSCTMGKLNLSKEEAHSEMNSVINNLSNIDGVKKVLDLEALKQNITEDLSEKMYLKKM